MASKVDIVNHLAAHIDGVTKKQAGEMVEAVFDHITECLADGDKVTVPGFGTFLVSRREARQGRNPATGKPIMIRASNSVRFKAGKALKDAVN